MRRGLHVELPCARCSSLFTRSIHDVKSRLVFCSRTCRDRFRAVGRTMVDCVCEGCSTPFRKIATEFAKRRHHYCNTACYMLNVDHRALGILGGKAPKVIAPEVARARSRKGGLARARNLTPERMREIALAGVRSRQANPAWKVRALLTRRTGGSPVVFGVRLGKPVLSRPVGRPRKTQDVPSPARGCEGSSAVRQVANPADVHQELVDG